MPYHQDGAVKYFTFDSLDPARVIHAAFTRLGGVSPRPWDSLNFGSTVGDEAKNVVVNRHRAFECLGLDYQSSFDVWQVHGRDIAIADAPRHPEVEHQKADIIMTDKPGVVLLMRFADCVPLLFYDPRHHVVGIAHAGWQGTVKGVASTAVEALHTRFQADPQDLIAVIGPSIGPDHYQIGPDVANQVVSAFGQDASAVLKNEDGRISLDLWLANRIQLDRSGVKNIESTQICTACHLEDWYSHRGQHGRTGRFGVLIALRG
jgi:hypothetical protein